MPKGDPKASTLRIERYQKKAGYKAKTFKLREEICEQFAAACEKSGVSQAQKIMEFMESYVNEVMNTQ